jgi:hypothetical protein
VGGNRSPAAIELVPPERSRLDLFWVLAPEVLPDSFPPIPNLHPPHRTWAGKFATALLMNSTPAASKARRMTSKADCRCNRTFPPGDFVARAVIVTVMGSAQRYGELVADLETRRAGLSEPEVVGRRWGFSRRL